MVDGSFKLILITLGDVGGVTNLKSKHGILNGAGAILSIVRIGILGGDTSSVVDVLEGVGWETTVAAVVVEVSGAVNELLLSIGCKDTVLDKVGALKATDSGEGPARTTAALIFDGGNSTLVLPVPGVRSVGSIRIGSQRRATVGSGAILFGILLIVSQIEVLGEFFESHGRELIDALLPGVLFIAIMLDNLIDFLEELNDGIVRLQVDWGQVFEFSLELVPHGVEISFSLLHNAVDEVVIVSIDISGCEGGKQCADSSLEHGLSFCNAIILPIGSYLL